MTDNRIDYTRTRTRTGEEQQPPPREAPTSSLQDDNVPLALPEWDLVPPGDMVRRRR